MAEMEPAVQNNHSSVKDINEEALSPKKCSHPFASLPAALPTPGPPAAAIAFARDSSCGGGPSTVSDTTSCK